MLSDAMFEDWIGPMAAEDDGGWSREVWDAAWEAATFAVMMTLQERGVLQFQTEGMMQ